MPAADLHDASDRLVLDIDWAEAAQRVGNRLEAAGHLDHAQDIVSGLASTLDVDEAQALLRAGHVEGPPVAGRWIPPTHLGRLPAPW